MNDKSGNRRGFFIRGLLAAAAALIVAVSVSCGGNALKDPYISVSDPGVTVENIVLNADDYFDKEVTVAATIKGTFGERAFLLHGEKLVDELLAVGADPYPESPNEKFDYRLAPVKAVQVTGVVRKFDAAAIERETGVRLDDPRLNNFAGKPVLIVKSLKEVEK